MNHYKFTFSFNKASAFAPLAHLIRVVQILINPFLKRHPIPRLIKIPPLIVPTGSSARQSEQFVLIWKLRR